MKYEADPVLEYRKFLASAPRSSSEREKKLASLEGKLSRKDILIQYMRGCDILDPEICDREALLEFAHDNGLSNDPQVAAAIAFARPKAEFNKITNNN